LAVFRQNSLNILTKDTDSGRLNSNPSFVVTSTGQAICFYSKYFTSGRTSVGRVTLLSGFQIQVDAGSGTLNGNSVSWSTATPTLEMNTFVLVYVNASGNVLVSTNWTMTTLKTSIVLAYVNVGNSAIVYIEEVPQTGNYIYIRKQVLSGSSWIWDDTEQIINTGEQPRAAYNSSNGIIYLSYRKDGIPYLRLFDTTNEVSWNYIRNSTVTSSVINLNNNPQINYTFSAAAGSKASLSLVNANLFPIMVVGFGFILESGVPQPYIFLGPIAYSSYVQYITSAITYNIYTYNGSTYTLEASTTIPYPFREDYTNWFRWMHTTGPKYIGIQCNTILFPQPFRTDPSNYSQVTVTSHNDVTLLAADTWNSLMSDNVFTLKPGAGNSSIVKTFEYSIINTFQSDNLSFLAGAGNLSSIVKTFEYDIINMFQTDNLFFTVGAGNQVLIDNIVYH
jgi:hypothetical protein